MIGILVFMYLLISSALFLLAWDFSLFHKIQETQKLVTTVLDVQPRVGGGGGAKSNDDIVYELAESILGKLMEKMDLDDARQDMFEVSVFRMSGQAVTGHKSNTEDKQTFWILAVRHGAFGLWQRLQLLGGV